MSELPKLVIVGGSLAGLMVAQLCKDRHDVLILEQNEKLYSGKHTGGLSLGPWATKVFERHLPAQSLPEGTIQNQQLLIIGSHAIESILLEKKNIVSITSWAAAYQVLRQGIIDPDCDQSWHTTSGARPRLRTDAQVKDAKYKDGKCTITYGSGAAGPIKTETADVLVAADGAHSTIRRVTLADARPRYTGRVAWRGQIPEDTPVPEGIKGTRHRLIWYKMRGHYIILYAVPILGSGRSSNSPIIEWCWYYPYEDGTDPDLENIMSTFVDQEPLPDSSLKALCATKWSDHLQRTKKDLPGDVYDMLSKCETPWVTKVTFTDGIFGNTSGEHGSVRSDADGPTLLEKKLFFVGEAYAQLPPNAGSALDAAAEQALALKDHFESKNEGEEEEEGRVALPSWVREVTNRRQLSSENFSDYGMGFVDSLLDSTNAPQDPATQEEW